MNTCPRNSSFGRTLLVLSLCALLPAVILVPACVGPALTIQPSELPAGVADTSYAVNLIATASVVHWAVSNGSLPPGLDLDSRTGLLAGRPTTPGTYDFTVTASFQGLPARIGTQFYTVTILPKLTAVFTPPDGRAGDSYNYTPQIAGGVPPYSVQIVGLPAGLDYDRFTGRIFGSPLFQSAGLRLDFTVSDSGNPQQTATASDVIVVRPTGVTITTDPNLPGATVGTPYSVQLAAAQGFAPYHWVVEDGLLPAGLRLNTATGLISGTPTAQATTMVFTIVVTDVDNPPSHDSREFRIVLGMTITTTTLPNAAAGQAYNQTIGVAGGKAPYTFSITSGQLPAGLSLGSSSGTITGTPDPNTAATTTFTVNVTDSDTPPATVSKDLKIVVPVTISTDTLPGATVGVPYGPVMLEALHGVPPYTWSLTSGTLPAGLQLDSHTGVISGTPTGAAGAQTFTVRAADSDQPQVHADQPLTIQVTTGP